VSFRATRGCCRWRLPLLWFLACSSLLLFVLHLRRYGNLFYPANLCGIFSCYILYELKCVNPKKGGEQSDLCMCLKYVFFIVIDYRLHLLVMSRCPTDKGVCPERSCFLSPGKRLFAFRVFAILTLIQTVERQRKNSPSLKCPPQYKDIEYYDVGVAEFLCFVCMNVIILAMIVIF
jgi:hypothetical protein